MDKQEDNLKSRVSNAVDGYRLAYFAFAIFISIAFSSSVSMVGAVFLGALLYVGYLIGLSFLVQYLSATIPPEIIAADFYDARINEINKRLEDGSLTEDSEELEAMMKAAGLRPLTLLVAKGPQIGIQEDCPIYDWVETKEGLKGEVHRFTFVCKADLGEDNVIRYEPRPGKAYSIVEGMLYERDLDQVQDVAK